jgi:hypothetical protein
MDSLVFNEFIYIPVLTVRTGYGQHIGPFWQQANKYRTILVTGFPVIQKLACKIDHPYSHGGNRCEVPDLVINDLVAEGREDRPDEIVITA